VSLRQQLEKAEMTMAKLKEASLATNAAQSNVEDPKMLQLKQILAETKTTLEEKNHEAHELKSRLVTSFIKNSYLKYKKYIDFQLFDYLIILTVI